MLKQPLEHPMSPAREVILLCAAQSRKLLHVEPQEVGNYCSDLFAWFEDKHPDIAEQIEKNGNLDADLKTQILMAVDEFQKEKSNS